MNKLGKEMELDKTEEYKASLEQIRKRFINSNDNK